jgi:hypothetical protein
VRQGQTGPDTHLQDIPPGQPVRQGDGAQTAFGRNTAENGIVDTRPSPVRLDYGSVVKRRYRQESPGASRGIVFSKSLIHRPKGTLLPTAEGLAVSRDSRPRSCHDALDEAGLRRKPDQSRNARWLAIKV